MPATFLMVPATRAQLGAANTPAVHTAAVAAATIPPSARDTAPAVVGVFTVPGPRGRYAAPTLVAAPSTGMASDTPWGAAAALHAQYETADPRRLWSATDPATNAVGPRGPGPSERVTIAVTDERVPVVHSGLHAPARVRAGFTSEDGDRVTMFRPWLYLRPWAAGTGRATASSGRLGPLNPATVRTLTFDAPIAGANPSPSGSGAVRGAGWRGRTLNTLRTLPVPQGEDQLINATPGGVDVSSVATNRTAAGGRWGLV